MGLDEKRVSPVVGWLSRGVFRLSSGVVMRLCDRWTMTGPIVGGPSYSGAGVATCIGPRIDVRLARLLASFVWC